MILFNLFLTIIIYVLNVRGEERFLGCGGFIKSQVPIDFTRIKLQLSTKSGVHVETISCLPNAYYFFHIEDIGDYVIQLLPPAGWSLTPGKVHISINGVSDLCSQGKDIDFEFNGFGITGIVESYGTSGMGPEGVTVELKSDMEVRRTTTKQNGTFFFTPVYPGKYSVSVSHRLWRFYKDLVHVHVKEGNTELPLGSLVVSGYDVTGYVKSDGQSADGIEIVLFQDRDTKNTPLVDGCKKTEIKELQEKGKQLCHIASSYRGNFTFDVVSPGFYFIIPYYKGQHVHFQPDLIEFQVGHSSLVLSESFKIIGFSVFGFVRASKDGKPLKGAHIFLNGKKVTTANEDGFYTLQNIKTDTYTIAVTAENMQFEMITLKINQHILQIPDFTPTLYRVCGNVISEHSHNILIARDGSTRTIVTSSASPDGKFCVHLRPGKYRMKVILNEDEALDNYQFFPTLYELEITDSPLLGIVFSQLKATVVGKVFCKVDDDCKDIDVVMKLQANLSPSEHRIAMVPLLDNGTYIFQNVRQGNYEISLAPNKFCWKTPTQIISVSSTNELVPPFIQSGYLVVFVSSHNSMVTYKANDKDKLLTIDKGRTSLCIEKPGVYEFTLDSCHVYEKNTISYNTDAKNHEITLTPVRHTVIVEIECEEDYGELYMIVTIDGLRNQEGPLEFKDKCYFFNLLLKPTDSAILVPHSEVLYVYPPILAIDGQDDCTNLGVKFRATKGRIFVGSVNPPIQGVSVTIEMDNSDTMTNETDRNGIYRFPPQDDSKSYKLYAKKDSYIINGPDEKGNFIAQKLAEIVVTAVYHDTNDPLQNVLLSLSGVQGYRRNIQTGEDGTVTFHSLTPGEYFLKPMKKEYTFEPGTKLIVAEEGLTIPVVLKGKRFAFSAYGQAISLNNDGEEKVTIIASGLRNCSDIVEEATSETNGQFRLRGLHPYCSYNVKVKHASEDKHIERGSPSLINISIAEKDINDLKFTVFKASLNTDVLVRLHCTNSEYYKTLMITMSRESNPAGLLYTTRLENYKITKNNAGILIYLPSLPLDYKLYYIQVESTALYADNVLGDSYYFRANTSFKYIDAACYFEKGALGQNIKQTSLWTLLIIFITLLGFYNIEYTAQVAKDQLNKLNIVQVISKLRPQPAPTEFVIDKNQIDQIVESINPTKKKLKPRKT